MKFAFFFLGAFAALTASASRTAVACANLASLKIPDVTITSAAVVEGACRVAATASPTSDSAIKIEVWIPASNWNGKLLGTANGGWSGAIPYPAMSRAVARGYAAVGTDTGHTGEAFETFEGHPEKLVDWAHRSIHVMTGLAKLVIRDHVGRFPDRSYFDGCSTGGQQGLSEAQRYPDDYDGIVVGDPGHNRLRLIVGFLWAWMAAHREDGQPILSSAHLSLVNKAVIDACDAQDGVKDGVLSQPAACTFDPAALMCKGPADGSCLTAEQVTAFKKVYAGPKNPRTGEQIFAGWARGSETGWPQYITAPREPVRVGFFKSFVFHDPNWDMRTFDWDRDVAYMDQKLPFVSALSTDLSAFRARGGKLIMYTGLADPVVPPADTIAYYDQLAKRFGKVTLGSFLRFFPVPGMGHCSGGAGTSTFDAIGALEQWVEKGVAPASLAGSRTAVNTVNRTRPICAYPNVARYNGTGSIDDARSFVCSPPSAQ